MAHDPLAAKRDAVLLLQQMQQKLDAAARVRHEPIAVIGIGCRFPGGATDPDRYWELLRGGVDAVGEIPPHRRREGGWTDAEVTPELLRGAFLDEVDRFDAAFFGIAPREAVSMDPQQRLVLETAWEALERAGEPAAGLAGTPAGVFLGCCSHDYSELGAFLGERSGNPYSATGVAPGLAAGRLSYVLGVQGPSLVVDTACSSSLVAVHLAVQSLRLGECRLALAGGVNLILLPSGTVTLSQLQALSPSGRCRAFDAGADGFVRGEGCGMVALKRLSDALADGSPVLAVIRGSAVNHDGRSSGLTAPNGPAQAAVIRAALENARLEPSRVSYLESHGTGTALGDPIEAHALAEVFSPRTGGDPLTVGSAKTNLGHLEAAAGIAGLIKVVLSLQQREIPPHLHFHSLNPHVQLGGFPLRIPTEGLAWEPREGSRVAGVSAFGFGGTNAHVVLEQAPEPSPEQATWQRPAHLLCLSAKSPEALEQAADQYESFLTETDLPLEHVSHTVALGRSHFPERLAVVAETAEQAAGALKAFRSGGASPGVRKGRSAPRPPRIAFLFTGQGSQYRAMGRRLYETQPRFRDYLDRCDALLRGQTEQPLLSLLFDPEAPLDRTGNTQPALFALEMALADLWKSWGVEPGAVLGHSVGEYAAACVAGAFSLEDGLRLMAGRGRLMQALPPGGAMAAAAATSDGVRAALGGLPRGVEVAAENGPAQTVLSGDAGAIEAAVAALRARGIAGQLLPVSHAFHSHRLDPMLPELEALAGTIPCAEARIDVISNLTGRPQRTFDAAYWSRHARARVRFADGLRTLAAQGYRLFLEIGPHPVLGGLGARCLDGAEWLPSLRRGTDDWAMLLDTAARLYTAGVPLDWRGFDRGLGLRTVSLPTYPFARERHWWETARPAPPAAASGPHPLLGIKVSSEEAEAVWETTLSPEAPGYLADHCVNGTVLFPAAGMLLAARAGGEQVLGGAVVVEEVELRQPLVLDAARAVRLTVTRGTGTRFSLCSRDGDRWTEHAAGRLCLAPASPEPASLAEARARCTEERTAGDFYDWLGKAGLEYGPAFRRAERIWVGENEAVVRLAPGAAGTDLLDPPTLDACLQAAGAAAWGGDPGARQLPAGIASFHVIDPRSDGPVSVHAVVVREANRTTADIRVFAGERLAAEIRGLRLEKAALAVPSWGSWLYETAWRSRPLERAPSPEQIAAGLSLSSDVLDGAERERGRELDRLAAAYAREALQAVREESVAPRHLRLYAHLWSLALTAPEERAEVLAEQLRTKGRDGDAALDLLAHCGSQLAEVLTGERDPLALLFEGGRAERLYHDSRVYDAMSRLAAQAVQAALPTGRPVRILEVGAGTGGTTAAVLPALPAEGVEYWFTDLSPQLLAQARERFSGRTFMRFERLDVTEDPGPQGFTARSFDLILAANVLHATPDLEVTLSHLERLLAPGGSLVLLEGSGPQGWIDVVFGLTDGWWCFTDTHRRPSYPLLTSEGWLRLLRERGWSAAASLAPVEEATRQAVVVARPGAADRDGVCAVFADERGYGEALAEEISRRGGRCRVVRRGDSGAAIEEALRSTAEAPIGQVVHLWSLDSKPDAVLESQEHTCGSVLRMLQALGDTTPRLLLVTRGATEAEPLQATTTGLGQAIRLERPELRCMCLDLDPAVPPGEAARQIVDELEAEDGEERVAYRGGARRVPRLARVDPEPEAPLAIRADATYLIAGGLGGLGLRTAQWLVDAGARHLLLLGRSELTDDRLRALDALARSGAQVHYRACDLSRAGEVDRVLKEAAATLPPIRGVVHAAGVLADGMLDRQDWTRFEEVFRPKVAGAWNLYRGTSDLDFLALFSSAVSLVGAFGQANHVAASAFLDALAQHARAHGVRAVSLGWGAWSEIGAAAERAGETRFATRGMEPIPPDAGIAALRWSLGQSRAHLGVLPVHWPTFLNQFGGGPLPSALAELAAVHRPLPAAQAATPAVVPPAPLDLDRASLLQWVRSQAAAVLGFSQASAVRPDAVLFDQGLDSLMAVELRNRLQTRLLGELVLPSTLLFDYPTPEALADFLAGSLGSPAAEGPRGHAAQPIDTDTIAIVGLGCRFPGAEPGIDGFRELLLEGRDAVRDFPADRWSEDPYRERIPTRRGAFLDGIDRFDPGFFGIAPREAASMDPQQRLLLEVAWEALEDAAIPPDTLAGSPAGVFVGLCNYDYAGIAAEAGELGTYAGTGSAPSIVAGRLSYLLGLQGPSLVVDTACSSSLVATHLALQSLRQGECDLALAGGVNLILAHGSTAALSALQMLSPDGRCKAFDASADGFIRGEGCGVVVLKRLSDAERDGDRVLALIRGSAVNHDGRSGGLTAPNGPAQVALLRQALHSAGLSPEQVSYLEAHGTGTALGDPIELHALAEVFAGRESPLWVGSVKTNLGHLEAAAGVAGLIKTVLALQHRCLPPHLHFREWNPHIDRRGVPLEIPRELQAWEASEGRWLAGVSSFGFSGTNAHVLLEAAPEPANVPDASSPAGHLLCLSAKDAAGLRALASRYERYLAELERDGSAVRLADVCGTAYRGRTHFDARLAVVGATAAELRERLRDWSSGGEPGQCLGAGEARLRDAGEAYVRGGEVDPAVFGEAGSWRKAPLPTYPFQRQSYWVERRRHLPAPRRRPASHPLLGVRLRSALPGEQYENELPCPELGWLTEHRVGGRAVLPGAAFLELALAAAGGPGELRDVTFSVLLEIEEPRTVQVLLSRDEPRRFEIFSAAPEAESWTLHASGVVEPLSAAPASMSPAARRESCPDELPVEELYAAFARQGFEYGPSFRTLTELRRGEDEALARVVLPESLDPSGYHLHPALLDGCLQAVGAALWGRESEGDYLPAGIDRARLFRSAGREVWCRVRLREAGAITADLELFGSAGEAVAAIEGLRLLPVRTRQQPATLHDMVWEPAPMEDTGAPVEVGAWLVLPDRGGLGARIIEALRTRGTEARVLREDEELASASSDGILYLRGLDEGEPEALCADLLRSVQALLRWKTPPRLVVVTRGARPVGSGDLPGLRQAPLWGIGSVIALEHPELGCRRIDLDAADPGIEDLVAELSRSAPEVALRGGSRYLPRLAPRTADAAGAGSLPDGPAALRIARRGTLSGLEWVPEPRRELAADEVEIRVHATGLNFRDVMNVLGAYPGNAGEPGIECAGVIMRVGRGVLGLAPGQPVVAVTPRSFATYAVASAELVAPLPDGLSFAEAASTPVAFLTARYALRHFAGLRPGQRVLIHAAAGGVGLAAVRMAQQVGAEVFATAGSPEKREYLRGLGVAYVGDSRSLEFATEIRSITGDGVDVVLNCLSGEAIRHGFDVLRPGGCFLEIGKAGIWDDTQAAAYRADVRFHTVALDAQILSDPATVGEWLRTLTREIASGQLQPLPSRSFPLEDAESAFRFMEQARHIGKIVLVQTAFRPEAEYLITGGLGALGLETARWMVRKGARHLTLVGRSAPSAAARQVLEELNEAGAKVQVARADVSLPGDVDRVLSSLRQPLAGIVHAAGVLDDGILVQQTPSRLASVMAPKVRGAWNLHRATLGRSLDFFVMYSSLASVVGSAGQAPYSAANAYLDALAWHRRTLGLPALSINWPAWAGSGMAGRAAVDHAALEVGEGLALLDRLLREPAPQVCVVPGGRSASAPDPQKQSSLADQLAGMTEGERSGRVREEVRKIVSRVLGLGDLPLDPRRSFHDLGLDSLMALEVRNALQEAMGHALPAGLLFDYPTLESLAQFVAEALAPASAPEAPAPVVESDSLRGDTLLSELEEELRRGGY
ncbi:MAG: SDR family NAD(P)-dependent oxidoreductase [Armatimonadota bacterium]